MPTTMETHAPTLTAQHDLDSLGDRLLKLTLLINIVAPAALFLIAYLLRAAEIIQLSGLIEPGIMNIIFFVFLFITVSELGIAFVIKKSVFAPAKVRSVSNDPAAFAKLATAGSATLAALGAAAMFYGIILVVLGAEMTRVAVFALFALVHFRLFRPSADFLRSLLNQAV